MKLAGRMRLSTLLLLMVVPALAIGLYAEKRRQTELRRAILPYRFEREEGVVDALALPIALNYPDGASLEQMLRDVKKATTGMSKLPAGIPIYVDPIGLKEADKTLASSVRSSARDDILPLRERLTRILKPLGLGFSARDGFLMITSEDAFESPDHDPYLGYRDVLR
jgi:hypothetical protein